MADLQQGGSAKPRPQPQSQARTHTRTGTRHSHFRQPQRKSGATEPQHFCGPSLQARGLMGESQIAAWRRDLLLSRISLVVVNLRSPFSLLNSLQSWARSGLLGMVDEAVAILSQASAVEVAMCESFGVRVVQPRHMSIPEAHKRKRNLLTLGSAFYHGLRLARNDHVLFLESDFEMDPEASLGHVHEQLLGAVGLLDRGASLVRLSSRKNMGAHSFPHCAEQPLVVSSDPSDVLLRKRNWFRFYCPTERVKENGHSLDDHVSSCLTLPVGGSQFKCFTSRDSGWSLNACMVRKSGGMNLSYSFRLPISDRDQRSSSLQDLRRAYPVHSMTLPQIGVRFCSQKQVRCWNECTPPTCLAW